MITCKLDPNKWKFSILSCKQVYVRNCSTKGALGKCWRNLTEGGGGVQEPLILADVICEQSLTLNVQDLCRTRRALRWNIWETNDRPHTRIRNRENQRRPGIVRSRHQFQLLVIPLSSPDFSFLLFLGIFCIFVYFLRSVRLIIDVGFLIFLYFLDRARLSLGCFLAALVYSIDSIG